MNQDKYRHPFREGVFFHIFARTINREFLFTTNKNKSYFLDKWKQYFGAYMDNYAYCLMDTHFHFVTRIKCFDNKILSIVAKENTTAANAFLKKEQPLHVFLEDQFRRFLNGYAKAFNKQQERRGSLFQKGFCRVALENKQAVLNAICYVHHNPIHHLGVATYMDWDYSSYFQLLSKAPSAFLAKNECRALFDEQDAGSDAFILQHQIFKDMYIPKDKNTSEK